MKKELFLPIATFIVGAGIMVGASQALAFEPGASNGDLVKRIAERFGKTEAEVQAIFDEVRAEHQQEREQYFESKLSRAVESGTISIDQKNALLQKHKEIIEQHLQNRDTLRDKTKEERRAYRQEQRQALEVWAEDQGIDATVLRELFQPGKQGMKGAR